MPSSSREAIETSTPSAASARATAKPSPLLAPPTIATLCVRPRSMPNMVSALWHLPCDVARMDEGASIDSHAEWTVGPLGVRSAAMTIVVGTGVLGATRGGVSFLAPLLVSVLLAYAIEPFVNACSRLGLARPLGIVFVYSLLMAGLIVGGLLAQRQVVAFVDALPVTVKVLQESMERARLDARSVASAGRDGAPAGGCERDQGGHRRGGASSDAGSRARDPNEPAFQPRHAPGRRVGGHRFCERSTDRRSPSSRRCCCSAAKDSNARSSRLAESARRRS